MGYPKNLINEGEDVALDLRPHWWYFSRHILTGIPLAIGIVIYFRLHGTIKDIVGVVVGGLLVIWAVWLLFKFLEWSRTYFVVTSDRVIWRTGLLSRHGVEMPLERINNINFKQGIWERMIGAGTLDVQSAGEQGTSQFTDVRHPDGVQQEIYRQMEISGKADAGKGAGEIGDAVAKAIRDSGAGGGGGGSVSAKIDDLAKMRDQGHITAEEFERRKADLLDKM
jgi:membrane protein YdbS with pleckstrin-like domain